MMPDRYPGTELSVEQLVHALAQVLDPDSPLRRKLLGLGPREIYTIERDLSEILLATRAIRNTSVHANRLPPEILSRVLEYRTHEQDLVAATHVCRYWRSTLISTPSLWTCFQFHSKYDLDRTLTYLERSKPAPIDVNIEIKSQGFEVLRHLASHVTRTRSLIIQGSHGVRTASDFFCNPAPSLQHLEVLSRGTFLHLPENFLGQQAPSLRFVSFSGIFPTFESPFVLPNLTEFSLYTLESAGPFHMSGLLRFFSDSPRLQKVHIDISSEVLQDIPPDRTISLESLEELHHVCHSVSRALPFLRLPCLKRLRVSSSLGPGRMPKLADILPYGGHALLAGATKMWYHSDRRALKIDLSGNGVDVSFSMFHTTADPTTVDWLFDPIWIPFGQIEDLKVEVYPAAAGFPISVLALENLRILRVTLHDTRFTEGFLRMFHPDPGTGVPCQSLREIEYTSWGSPESRIRPLITLVMERKRVGYQLRLVHLVSFGHNSDQDSVEEMRGHVGEVRVRAWEEGM